MRFKMVMGGWALDLEDPAIGGAAVAILMKQVIIDEIEDQKFSNGAG